MKVILNGPKSLGNGKPGSFKVYKKGLNDLDEDVIAHDYTQALFKRGDITLLADVEAAKAGKSGVAVSEHEKVKAENAKLKEELAAAQALLEDKGAEEGKGKGKKSA